MKNEKVNSFAVGSFIVCLSGSSFYGLVGSYIISKTNTSFFISMIIGYLISLIFSSLIFKYFDTKKDKKLLNLLLTTCGYLFYILFIYRLTSFLSSQYLIETPKLYMITLIVFVTYYMSSKGSETLTRVSTISLFLSTFIFLFDFISLVPKIELSNYLPIIFNTKNVLITSLIYAFYFSLPVFYINVLDKKQIVDYYKFKKTFYIMNFISFIISLISITTTIGVNGVNIANLFDYPLYSILKRINIFEFLDSIENISIMLWILYIINASSIILLYIKNNLIKFTNINKNILDILLTSISIVTLYILFLNNTFLENLKYIYIPFIGGIFLLILIIIGILISKKD